MEKLHIQEAWLKPYVEINADLSRMEKSYFEKEFFKLINNTVFGKAMENVRKNRYIKLVTTEARRNPLVSKPNYHTTKYFSENLLAIEMKTTLILMNSLFI